MKNKEYSKNKSCRRILPRSNPYRNHSLKSRNSANNLCFISPLPIALGVVIVTLFILATQHFYPILPCPIKDVLHIDCPGCGGTRAVNAMLNGKPLLAIKHNGLVIAGFFIITCFFIYSLIQYFCWGKIYKLRFSLFRGLFLLAVILTFTIIRNL